MRAEIELFSAHRGSVTAPAGCGKTQLIANCLRASQFSRPVLVLTHTNAGAAALRTRLQKAGVSSSKYRLLTLDGFALRIVRMFPMRSELDPLVLELRNKEKDYPAIRHSALRILSRGHISHALKATYERVLIDEYQDCDLDQHAIVTQLSLLFSVAVLGDPMQAIFGFDGTPLVNWKKDVLSSFPSIGELSRPWRWENAGTQDLGKWLLKVREQLEQGGAVDLASAPKGVEWIRIVGAGDQQRMNAARFDPKDARQSVLVIGDSRNTRGRLDLCSKTPGATAVESVELGDLIQFSSRFNLASADALEQIVGIAAEIMTQVGKRKFLNRVGVVLRGKSKSSPTPAELAAVKFCESPDMRNAGMLIDALQLQKGARVFRPEVLRCLRAAISEAAGGSVTFPEAVLSARERGRFRGRLVSRRAVGSTLLLKGLESDVAVVLHPEKMNSQNLYVALTRGARRVLVCSEGAVIHPKMK